MLNKLGGSDETEPRGSGESTEFLAPNGQQYQIHQILVRIRSSKSKHFNKLRLSWQHSSVRPKRADDLGVGAHVDVAGARNIASQIALGGANRRAQTPCHFWCHSTMRSSWL